MRVSIFAVLAIALGITSYGAFAHMGATGIVKQRMDAMKEIGRSMKTVGRMIKGETAFNSSTVAKAAETIEGHAEEIPELFPDNEESRQPVSEATDAIWLQNDRFEAIAQELANAAVLLGEAAETDDPAAVRAAFAQTGRTCSACHEDFRQKKQ